MKIGTAVRARLQLSALIVATGAFALLAGACTQAQAPTVAGQRASFSHFEMHSPRADHGATALGDGRVLLVGGCVKDGCEQGQQSQMAELFNPDTGLTRSVGPMMSARVSAATAVLSDGRALIVGGWSSGQPSSTAEIFDPATELFSDTVSMTGPRTSSAVVAMPGEGQVLFLGGSDGKRGLRTVEAFVPGRGGTADQFLVVGRLHQPRAGAEAVLLDDGRILVAGGDDGRYGRGGVEVFSSAEIFDPATGTSEQTGSMSVRRHKHAAVRLDDGRVLVVGGSDARDFGGQHRLLERYDPTTGRFEAAGSLHFPRFKLQDAVLRLASGRVLIAGGARKPEVWDPVSQKAEVLDVDLGGAWYFASATALPDGRVLVAGGYTAAEGLPLTAGAWLVEPPRVHS